MQELVWELCMSNVLHGIYAIFGSKKYFNGIHTHIFHFGLLDPSTIIYLSQILNLFHATLIAPNYGTFYIVLMQTNSFELIKTLKKKTLLIDEQTNQIFYWFWFCISLSLSSSLTHTHNIFQLTVKFNAHKHLQWRVLR